MNLFKLILNPQVYSARLGAQIAPDTTVSELLAPPSDHDAWQSMGCLDETFSSKISSKIMKNRNPKWLIIWLLSALSCLAQPLLVEGVPSPVPASANGIYERQSTGWAKGTEWRIARAGSYWTLDQYVDGAWSIGSVLSANQSPSPWAAPWPGGMSVTLADPGTIGSAGGGAITDPGTIGAPGVQPSIDPFLRPYPQNLSEEQKAAVLENLGILNPDELNALLESFAKPPRTALDVLDSADHLYFLSEAGNTIFDAKGDLNLTVTGTISDAAFDPFFDTSRVA